MFAQQLEDLRALPAAQRLYEPPPKFATNAEARAWIMPRVCQLPLPMAQAVLDGVLSDTEFCKQKQRLAVGEDEVAPSRAACELFAEGANLLNSVLPGGEGDGSKVAYSEMVTVQLEGHRDCPQAQQRDDPLNAGPQGKCALRDAPHLRAMHRMAAADSVVRFEGLELALDKENMEDLGGGLFRSRIPPGDPGHWAVDMVLSASGIWFMSWDLATLCFHTVLNNGQPALNGFHVRHLPAGFHGVLLIPHVMAEINALP